MASRRRQQKKPITLSPEYYNLNDQGKFYRVFARPLVVARAAGHPFKGKKLIDITSYVTDISWSSSVDEAGSVSGTVSIKNIGNILGILVAGSRIIVQAQVPLLSGSRSGSSIKYKYETILQLIVNERDKNQIEFTLDLSVADRLSYLNTGEYDFTYKKKKGQRGYTASYIIKDVCRKKSIPFTKESIPTTNVSLNTVTQEKGTILQFFTTVLKSHNQLVDKKNGKKPAPPNWDINMRTGVLTIRPKKPQKYAWRIDERYFVADPSYHESLKDFATRIVVTGKQSEKKDKYNKDGSKAKGQKTVKKTIKVTKEDPNMIRVYGLIEKQVSLSGNVNHDIATKAANTELQKATRMKRELSFTCPALPNIWPGSKVYLHFPSYGMKGLFTVTSCEYHISGSDGPTMGITVDAGSVSTNVEAAPRIIAIKRAALHKRDNKSLGIKAGKTVSITWEDGKSITYTHPSLLQVKSVEVVHRKGLSEFEVPTKAETVVITYTKKRKGGKSFVSVRIKNRVTFGKGIESVTDEGYVS